MSGRGLSTRPRNRRLAAVALKRPVAPLWALLFCSRLACVVGVTAGALIAPAHPVLAATVTVLPSFEDVRAAHRPSDLRVLDRHGEPVSVLRVDYTERRGAWIPLSEVSPALQRAVLISEDRRFREHGGVDWQAVAGAGWRWLWGEGMRGASTISMQVAAMLDSSLQRPGGGRSLAQKFDQALQARRLEAAWTKEQILEAYLNLAAFRGELRGVDAVSRVMFGKYPHGLDVREAAVAAALLRGPNAAVDRVASRACALLVEGGIADGCKGLVERAGAWLGATRRAAIGESELAPHFARAAVSRSDRHDGAVLHTTLDAALQRVVIRSVQRHLAGMGHAQLTDAAVVVFDNASGEVLAYVGSSGSSSSAAEVDHARARRQAGSTLKPFLYALALESRYLTAASLLDDSPLDVATGAGLYIPQNYDRDHAGLVSVRTALAASLNIPAVRTLMLLGPERFADRLRTLGLPLIHDGDHYGYSLSLGSADVDLLSLTNAYRALADDGRWSEPVLLPASPQRSDGSRAQVMQVMNPLATWVVGDILSDRQARARTFGLESALATRFWSAVKTGTSKDMRDNWCLGWSERYTVGVWVGNSQGLSMRDVTGVSGAAPIWHEVMAYLHAETASRQPAVPAALERRQVIFGDDLEASRMEYFLPGTALTRIEPVVEGGSTQARIIAPVADTVIALDPDMPLANQRLALRASAGRESEDDVQWRVGENIVAEGAHSYWLPAPGTHRLTLTDGQGRVMDAVTVHVRGVPRARAQR